jgi:hypothetical protein
MSIIGTPVDWDGFFANDFVPTILGLVLDAWSAVQKPSGDAKEDPVSVSLCCALRQIKTTRNLMFQVRTQDYELHLPTGKVIGIKDIVFAPLTESEDIYFCLECKRLNVVRKGKVRSYASEYVRKGMLRFVVRQYAQGVRHAGMVGYVLDGQVADAMGNVEKNIRKRHVELGMTPPGVFQSSSIRPGDVFIKETHHTRLNDPDLFRLHHLFLSCVVPSSPAPPIATSPPAISPQG